MKVITPAIAAAIAAAMALAVGGGSPGVPVPSFGQDQYESTAGYVPKTPTTRGDYEAIEVAARKRERKAARRIELANKNQITKANQQS